MKKRIVSMLLTIAMLFSLVPSITIGVSAKNAEQMTEAEAFAAGLDVYIAWYNHHRSYNGIVTDSIEAFYKDENSAFNQLYSQIYPDGAASEDGEKLLARAQKYIEDHYDGVDQFEQAESEIVMSILLACMLYTGQSENSDNNDVLDVLEATSETLDNGLSIYNYAPVNYVLYGALKSSELLSEKNFEIFFGDILGNIGDWGYGVTFDLITSGFNAEIDRKEAIATATKYDTIKSASSADIDILRRHKNMGFIGDYLKAYITAYDELWETGSSSFRKQLLESNVNYTDTIIDITTSSITFGVQAAAEAAAASSNLGWLTTATEAVMGVLLGFELFNIIEGVWKLGGDLLFGQTAMKTADLTLFYLDFIRETFYHGYVLANQDFRYEPTVENAKLLNTYSRFMYRVFAASEMYASQLNHTYATAGLINAEWMHYIPGKIDPALTSVAEKQSERLMQLRKNYLYNACDAYSAFCDSSVYTISLNLNGGVYLAAEQLGFGSDELVLCKIKSIDINIPRGIPVRDGYRFAGWSTNSGLARTVNQIDYLPGDTYTADGDISLYAVWEEDVPNTVTYNAGNGTGAPKSHEYTAGTTTISTIEPTRTGYNFRGWTTVSGSTTGDYHPGDVISADTTGPLTLYAVWEPGVFNVIFKATEGGTFSNGTDTYTMQKTYNASFTVNPEIPIRDGFIFNGWNEAEDGSGKAHTQGSVTYDIGDNSLDDKYLYSQWIDPNAPLPTYTITYDYNDGQFTGTTPTTPTETKTENVDYTISTTIIPAYDGYTFKGWALGNDLNTVVYNPGDTYTTNADLYLYAVWEVASQPSGFPLTLSGTIKNATVGSASYGSTISGVTVELLTQAGGVVATTTSDANGIYTFTVPEAATYQLRYTKTGFNSHTTPTVIVVANTPSFGITTLTEVEKAETIVAEGTCGDNLTWKLNDEGVLTISGAGVMTAFNSGTQPWAAHREDIVALKLENGIASIGMYAFDNCDLLTKVDIPDSVTSIGRYAFYGCALLNEVKLGRNLTSMAEGTFGNCPKLTVLTIPDALSSDGIIGDTEDVYRGYGYGASSYTSGHTSTYGAFYNTPITTVYVPSTVTSIPSEIYNHGTLAEFICEESEYIDGNGYLDDGGILYKYNIYTEAKTLVRCPNKKAVKDYTILDDTTTIQGGAFVNNTALSEVHIPATVINVGASTFSGCSNLTAAYFYGDTPATFGADVFKNAAASFVLYYIEDATGWTNPWNGYNTATFVSEDTDVAVTSVTLNKSSATLDIGGTLTLTATVSPSDATNKTVTWTSSNSSVAKVSGGMVTALSAGTTTITATTADGGFKVQCVVTVNAKEIPADTPMLTVGSVSAAAGNTVVVPITLSNNPGIVSMSLEVAYDESVLTLTGVEDTGLLSGAMHTTRYSSPYALTWENDTIREDITVNGTIVYLTFTVSETAEAGTYTIQVTTPMDGIYNYDGDNVDFALISGTVTVRDYIIGDVNGDGVVTNKDRLLLARYLAKWDEYDISMIDQKAADINEDGFITNKDRLYLARHLAKWEGYETLPIK